MSNDMIRELFRGVESTLYERLRIIEDILTKQRQEGVNPPMEGVEKRLHETAEQINRVETATTKAIQEMNAKVDKWFSGMNAIEQQIQNLREELHSRRKVDERPVELVQAQLEEKVPVAAALDAKVNATEVEQKAKQALTIAVRALPVELEEEEVEEEEEEEVDEEVEEEVEEEEEGEALTEFEFKGKTYYHDSDYKVYIPDADGAVSDPVGIYDPQTKRIRRLT